LINDQSPSHTFSEAEKKLGDLRNKKIALLGVAYRFNSEDTRNSPTLALANYLRKNGVKYIMHDPYVKEDDQNLTKFDQQENFTNDLDKAIDFADYVFICTAHRIYMDNLEKITSSENILGIYDASNIYKKDQLPTQDYAGIGRGTKQPEEEFIKFVYESFRAVENGLARELQNLINFYNENYAFDEFNKVKFEDVQRLAKTCSTGCEIADPEKVTSVPTYNGFSSQLAKKAALN
jgi:hypothetical protein